MPRPGHFNAGKRPGTHFIAVSVGRRDKLDTCRKSCPPTGIRFPDRSAVARCYTDWAVLAHITFCIIKHMWWTAVYPQSLAHWNPVVGIYFTAQWCQDNLCWRLNQVVLQCVVTEFLHVIITTLFEAESTKNRHENALIFQQASASLSTTISACESSEVIVCIGVPVLCIPKRIAKKTPDLWNISGSALRETADGFINVYSHSACDVGFLSFIELTAQLSVMFQVQKK